MSKITTISQGDARPDVDGLLRDYFEAEMPQPWPAFKAPKQTRGKRPVSSWSRYSSRVALAACVALLVAGYMALAGFFPTRTPTNGVIDQTRAIGAAEKKGKIQPEEPMLPLDNDAAIQKSR